MELSRNELSGLRTGQYDFLQIPKNKCRSLVRQLIHLSILLTLCCGSTRSGCANKRWFGAPIIMWEWKGAHHQYPFCLRKLDRSPNKKKKEEITVQSETRNIDGDSGVHTLTLIMNDITHKLKERGTWVIHNLWAYTPEWKVFLPFLFSYIICDTVDESKEKVIVIHCVPHI